jgi:hypothetical protein
MEDIHLKAERNIPGLRHWLDKSLALCNGIIDNARYSESDHMAFMSLCFLCKQINHAKSVLALIPNIDAILISRSMLEGLSQLLWAANEPNVRPLRWRQFAWVHDWRLMQAADVAVDPEQRVIIQDALKEFGNQFLTPKAKKSLDKGETVPADPYYKNWRIGCQISQIFETVKGEDLYYSFYEPFSDWHHWGAGGFGKVISRHDDRIVYSSLSSTDAATVIATAIQCLIQTIKFVDEHLDLGLTSKISEVYDGYITWSKSQGA